MSKSVSVIIPFYNRWELTHQRMMELYSHIHTPIEIILVDDCSTDDVSGGMGWWKTQSKHRVICIKTPKNLGFGGAHNHGAKRATGDVLIFLSNDVRVSGDFVSQLLKKLDDDENVLIGGRVLSYDTGWNLLQINGKPKLFPYCMGWLVACTKEVWGDLGGWDDIYAPFDYEDVDISAMAIHKGYKLVGLNSEFVLHDHPGATIHKIYGVGRREQITRRNQKSFIEKWSKILIDE